MKRFLLMMLFITLSTLTLPQNNYSTPSISGGLQVGYNNGIGFQGNIIVKNLAAGFPFYIKLSSGISFLDPGKPLDARKIFINDATNGIPEKSGRLIELGCDFLYNAAGRTFLFAGPRLALFTANFNFIGGNEDFDVTSNQWGAGIGIENYFRISQSLDLVFSFGYDYFFSSVLYGHDTSYSPDGQNVNARKDFTFEDADKAINQPKHNLKAMAGLNYNF